MALLFYVSLRVLASVLPPSEFFIESMSLKPIKPKILIADSDLAAGKKLASFLTQQYRIAIVSDGAAALKLVFDEAPDLFLLDAALPQLSGLHLCKHFKATEEFAATPVLIMSSSTSVSARTLATEAGADDFLVKPIDRSELNTKLKLHLQLGAAKANLEEVQDSLDRQRRSLQELQDNQQRVIGATQDLAVFALAKLAESRDTDTGEHLDRMRDYSVTLARELSQCGAYVDQIDEQFIRDLYRSAPLHDIGKVGVSDSILCKPGPLTEDEFERMKLHTTIGAQTLEESMQQSTSGGFLTMATEIARSHHEWFDGTGYPNALSGQEIPLAARIVAVGDVFDALTSERCYKAAFSFEQAYEMIVSESGTHFDPVVIEAFKTCYPKMVASRTQATIKQEACLV